MPFVCTACQRSDLVLIWNSAVMCFNPKLSHSSNLTEISNDSSLPFLLAFDNFLYPGLLTVSIQRKCVFYSLIIIKMVIWQLEHIVSPNWKFMNNRSLGQKSLQFQYNTWLVCQWLCSLLFLKLKCYLMHTHNKFSFYTVMSWKDSWSI